VPDQITLDQLAKVAVIVDDLECYQATEVFAKAWMEQLGPPKRLPYGRDILFWMFVSSVFQFKDVFRSITRTAILYSDGPIPTLGLPIRDKLISEHSFSLLTHVTLVLTH